MKCTHTYGGSGEEAEDSEVLDLDDLLVLLEPVAAHAPVQVLQHVQTVETHVRGLNEKLTKQADNAMHSKDTRHTSTHPRTQTHTHPHIHTPTYTQTHTHPHIHTHTHLHNAYIRTHTSQSSPSQPTRSPHRPHRNQMCAHSQTKTAMSYRRADIPRRPTENATNSHPITSHLPSPVTITAPFPVTITDPPSPSPIPRHHHSSVPRHRHSSVPRHRQRKLTLFQWEPKRAT